MLKEKFKKMFEGYHLVLIDRQEETVSYDLVAIPIDWPHYNKLKEHDFDFIEFADEMEEEHGYEFVEKLQKDMQNFETVMESITMIGDE